MNTVAEFFAKMFHLCGHGKKNNWSVRIADYFFVDCGCCWFWRGAMFGSIAAAGIIFAATFVIEMFAK